MAPPGAAEHAAAMDAAAARGRAAASAVVGRVLGVCERGDSAASASASPSSAASGAGDA